MVRSPELCSYEYEELEKIEVNDYADMGNGLKIVWFTAPIELYPFYDESEHKDLESCEISLEMVDDGNIASKFSVSPVNSGGSSYDWNDVFFSLETQTELLTKALYYILK